MFLNMSSLKAVVFDLDSISSNNEFDWGLLPDSIDVLIFSKENEQALSRIQKQNPRFLVRCGIQLFLINKVENAKSINVIKDLLELPIHQFAIITGNRRIVRSLQKFPLNIIELNKVGYSEENDDYQSVADFQITSANDLLDIINYINTGYLSEFACQQRNVPQSDHKYSVLLVRDLETTTNKPVKVIAGGRYYPYNDARSYAHLLSRRILWNKRSNRSQYSLFVRIYSNLVGFVQKSVNPVDSICYVPIRPNEQEYDRFKEIVDYIAKHHQIINIGSFLSCIRDYGKQKQLDSFQRIENIRDVFSFSGDVNHVKDKHIVVIDDLLVTGSTTLELASMLYKLGAKQVTIVVLALNQMEKADKSDYSSIQCKCGAEMVVRVNMKQKLKCFFGCENFNDKAQAHNTLDFPVGLLRYFEANNKLIEKYENEQDIFFF